ncbi:MAG: hypothetical protein PHO91_00395 [Patescibacteria group bacterium]|nr:hypothetical protein [Patescibacteria group bacterium]
MKRFTWIALLILACLAWVTGCDNVNQVTPPAVDGSSQDTLHNFEQSMAQAIAGQSSNSQFFRHLKTEDPDTLVLAVRSQGSSGGYFYWEVKQIIYVSGEVRGYYLPFVVSISDQNGWTLVNSGVGEIYNHEPGSMARGTGLDSGYPFSMHVKAGWAYPTYVTSGEYAWFVFRNNSPLLLEAPIFSVEWKDDGESPTVLLRDANASPIIDYVLID